MPCMCMCNHVPAKIVSRRSLSVAPPRLSSCAARSGCAGPARLVARVRGSERGMGIRERNVMVSQSVSFVAVPPAHSTSAP